MERSGKMHARDEGSQDLPAVASVLAVWAHPDDESFGLGAVLSGVADCGVRTSVLCLTHGEASTLGTGMGDLHVIRERELSSAATALGVGGVRLLEFGDEGLPKHRLTICV
jgi:LmbE family N-acetylglucosaminyl deacetylase